MNIRVLLAAGLLAAAPLSAQTPAPAAPAAPATSAAAPARLPDDSMAIARRWVQHLYASRFDSALAMMAPDARAQMGSAAEFENRWMGFVAQAGSEVEVTEERWVRRNGQRQYWRTARFTDAPEPLMVRIVILVDGTIGGIGINPASQPPPIDP